jgi:benzoate/toluate 1,2-dioxygenase reductase component
MTYQIALNLEDGVTRIIEAREGERVADASYSAGINIPVDCREGACGTCKCRVESGDYDGGSYLEDVLTKEEAAQGYALACQMVPKTDLVLAIAATSEQCKIKSQIFKACVARVEMPSPTVIALSLSLEPGVALGFLPGQYVNVQVPGTHQRRSYSVSSPPGAKELSFLVRNIPPGQMSSFLREKAAPGTPIEFTGPAGSFYLREVTRSQLFLAGGTGLAPFLSMLGRIAEVGSKYPIHLIYGVTNDADLVAVKLLEELAGRIPGFTFLCCVAAEASTYPRKGYVTRYIDAAQLNGGDFDVYVCGPPPMVEAVRVWLSKQGIAPMHFYYEKFAPSGAVHDDRRIPTAGGVR